MIVPPYTFPLTAEQLALIAASVAALAFDHLPGLNAWFNRLDESFKRALMAALTLLIAACSQGLACLGILETGYACDQAGILATIGIWLGAISVNQATHLLTKPGARG